MTVSHSFTDRPIEPNIRLVSYFAKIFRNIEYFMHTMVIFQEREKLLSETKKREERLKKEMEAKEALAAKIKVLEIFMIYIRS